MDREAWHAAVHGLQRVRHNWVTELNWLLQWKEKKKRGMSFSFTFPENKEYRENSEQTWTFLVFYVNCSWLLMSVTKFAFLPPNSAGATTHIFSFDSMLNTSCLWCLSLLPFPFVVTYQKVGLRAIEQPHSITGLLMPVFETRQEEEIKILAPLFLITYSWLRVLALYKALNPHGGKTQFLRHESTVYPSPLAENKTHLLIFSKNRRNLSPYFSFVSIGR